MCQGSSLFHLLFSIFNFQGIFNVPNMHTGHSRFYLCQRTQHAHRSFTFSPLSKNTNFRQVIHIFTLFWEGKMPNALPQDQGWVIFFLSVILFHIFILHFIFSFQNFENLWPWNETFSACNIFINVYHHKPLSNISVYCQQTSVMILHIFTSHIHFLTTPMFKLLLPAFFGCCGWVQPQRCHYIGSALQFWKSCPYSLPGLLLPLVWSGECTPIPRKE